MLLRGIEHRIARPTDTRQCFTEKICYTPKSWKKAYRRSSTTGLPNLVTSQMGAAEALPKGQAPDVAGKVYVGMHWKERKGGVIVVAPSP